MALSNDDNGQEDDDLMAAALQSPQTANGRPSQEATTTTMAAAAAAAANRESSSSSSQRQQQRQPSSTTTTTNHGRNSSRNNSSNNRNGGEPSFRQRSLVIRRGGSSSLSLPTETTTPRSGSSLIPAASTSTSSSVRRQSTLTRRQMEQLIVEHHVTPEALDNTLTNDDDDDDARMTDAPPSSLMHVIAEDDDDDAVVVPEDPDDNNNKATSTTTTTTIGMDDYPITHPRNVAQRYTTLAFVNRSSGGQMGRDVFDRLGDLLGPDYVVDLSQCRPSKNNMPQDVLQPYALDPHVRLLVCGGDGTMGWIQSSIDIVWQRMKRRQQQQQQQKGKQISLAVELDQLERDHFPMAMIPLGTGNDLSRTFGWGKAYTPKLLNQVERYDAVRELGHEHDRRQNQVLVRSLETARDDTRLDRWRCVVIPHQAVTEQDRDWIPDMLGTTHGDRARDSIYQSPAAAAPKSGGGSHEAKKFENGTTRDEPEHEDDVLDGIFCNYFSIGFDAQVAFEFHKDRQAHPENYSSVTGNKAKYATMGITHGTKAPKLSDKITLLVSATPKNQKAEWKPVPIPSKCRAIVLCNIPSYAGGTKLSNQGIDCQDELMDVVFLTSVWHVALLSGVSPLLPCIRTKVAAQANRICLETHEALHCQVDGEPWYQGPATIHIRHFGQRVVLTRPPSSDGCGCGGPSASTSAVVETAKTKNKGGEDK